MENSTASRIEHSIKKKRRGTILFPADFAMLGTPEAVKKALLRLHEKRLIVRLAQGIYYYPKEDKQLGLGVIYPGLEQIANALAQRDKARIVPTGDYALHKLGLSTQVPANAVFITDGSPRRIAVGNGHGILFKHTSDLKTLAYKSDLMMLIVSAMRAIGEGRISEEQKQTFAAHLKNVQKRDFDNDIKLAPIWVRKTLIAIWNSIN
ncbi:MAG: hypothetical protein HUK14_04125 [Muribaculaceae bacterium]|nr:hypothetical protein [Muribaculaceae bacterium]